MEDNEDKGLENGNCNRSACQQPGAIWYNHWSKKWYCYRCSLDIGNDSFVLRDWKEFGSKDHPMFETRSMINQRTGDNYKA